MAKRRPSGDGMVRKREDGRWEGRIVVGHKDNGDSIFRYIYADTQKELTIKLRQNIDAFQGVELTEQSKMTLAQWLDEWLEKHMTGTVRPGTLEGYRKDMDNHVKPYLGEKLLIKLTSDDLRELYQLLLERGRKLPRQNCGPGLAPATVRGIHTTLHHALKTAADEGLIPFNPSEKVTPPSVPNIPKRVLTHDQLEKFLCAIRFDPIWHDFFYTELTTGLRRGELCGLKWEDFDSDVGTLKVRRTIHARKGWNSGGRRDQDLCGTADNSASLQHHPTSEGTEDSSSDSVDLSRSPPPGAASKSQQRIPQAQRTAEPG